MILAVQNGAIQFYDPFFSSSNFHPADQKKVQPIKQKKNFQWKKLDSESKSNNFQASQNVLVFS